MKKSFYSLFIAAIVSVTAVCVNAAETASQAIVLKVTGSPTAANAGLQPTALKVGDKLSEGTVIATPAGSEVEIQVFSGAVTTIKPNTTVDLAKLSISTSNGVVTKQSALIDLKVGKVVSNLDPTKKAINDYAVKTPKGVASARGTVFEVSVSATGAVQTFVTNGVVVFSNATTGQSVTVQPGFVVTVDAQGNVGQPVPNVDVVVPSDATIVTPPAVTEPVDPTIPSNPPVSPAS